MTVMKNIKMIRLVCGILILIGFFLPWLDMGEIMSEFAALAGGETSSTFSGYKLATAGIEMADQKSSPVLSLIPVLGILVALYPFNNQWFIYLGSILAIGIMLYFTPTINTNTLMYYGIPTSGMTAWAIGKILSIVGFTVILITAYLSGNKKETKST